MASMYLQHNVSRSIRPCIQWEQLRHLWNSHNELDTEPGAPRNNSAWASCWNRVLDLRTCMRAGPLSWQDLACRRHCGLGVHRSETRNRIFACLPRMSNFSPRNPCILDTSVRTRKETSTLRATSPTHGIQTPPGFSIASATFINNYYKWLD